MIENDYHVYNNQLYAYDMHENHCLLVTINCLEVQWPWNIISLSIEEISNKKRKRGKKEKKN